VSSLLDRLDCRGECMAWIKAHLDYPHDWCLIWPFAQSDTGYALFGNPPRKVHRLMCEYRHGPAPTPEHHAAHSCDRGHDACVNPRHTDWKTPSQNQYDRRRNGQERRKTKLTPDQAKEIRELKGLEHTAETAKRFGIRESNVRLIQSGKTWRKDKRNVRVFTDEEVLAIRAAPRGNGVAKQLAAQYGASISAIGRIRCGESYTYVQAPTPSDSRLDREGK